MLGLLHAPTPGCTCGCARIAIEGRTAIVVDDGIALGSSLFSWLDELRRRRPKRIVAAAPVGAQSVLVELAPRVDGVVCLLRPRDFRSSGSFYQDFPDVSRAEVLALLGHGGPPS
jgi:putative phosphoribosyl transferase